MEEVCGIKEHYEDIDLLIIENEERLLGGREKNLNIVDGKIN